MHGTKPNINNIRTAVVEEATEQTGPREIAAKSDTALIALALVYVGDAIREAAA